MFQEIAPHCFQNEYKNIRPDKDSYLLISKENQIFLTEINGEIQYPTFGELDEYSPDLYEEAIYLFAIDEKRFYYAKDVPCEHLVGYHWERVQSFRTLKPQYLAFAGITGAQLIRWYESRSYCGRCGTKTVHDDVERMVKCPNCGLMEYPKICPAVIIGVTDGNRLLMSKYAGREYKKYALLAGFAEIGETIEDTVRREVMEEVGLKVKNIRFYKSQPWSFSDSLLMGFYCDLDGSDEIVLDENELAMAGWFEREEIPDMGVDISLTNEMIRSFKNGGNFIDNVGTDTV